jgi:hypothetical protein
MSSVTVDPVVGKWLEQLKDVTELRDNQGNILGTFMPSLSVEEQVLYEKVKQLFDPAETERILREERGKGIPLAEFWKKLESQTQQ